jgi:hypothetical protein
MDTAIATSQEGEGLPRVPIIENRLTGAVAVASGLGTGKGKAQAVLDANADRQLRCQDMRTRLHIAHAQHKLAQLVLPITAI